MSISGVKSVVVGLLALMLLLASCSDSSDDSGDASSTQGDFAGGVAEEEFPASDAADEDRGESLDDAFDEGAQATGGDDGSGVSTDVDAVREIIYTAWLDIEVETVSDAAATAIGMVEAVGGVVFGQESTNEDLERTTLTFQVPPGDFRAIVDQLETLGLVRHSQISSEDVTARVVDLESRISTAEASVLRLRAFLEEATDVQGVAALESELVERETTLEVLRGQLRTIRGRVDLATITVTFRERQPGPEISVSETFYAGHDGGAACPGSTDTRVDENGEVTVCLVVTNTGDTHLADVVVRDEAFGLANRDFVVVEGDLADPLPPGERVILAAEFEARSSRSARGRAEAVPVDENGNELRIERVVAAGDAFLEVAEDDSLPGILDGLDAGWDALRRIVSGVLVAAGAVVVFIWIVPLLWLAVRWWRSRQDAEDATEEESSR